MKKLWFPILMLVIALGVMAFSIVSLYVDEEDLHLIGSAECNYVTLSLLIGTIGLSALPSKESKDE